MTKIEAEIDEILANARRSFGDDSHATGRGGDAVFTWDYERSRDGLSRLYEKAKRTQWNATGDGWLRQRFTEIGVIEYEDHGDAQLDVELLDAVTADRLAAL